jgi:CspA family cold shock protein
MPRVVRVWLKEEGWGVIDCAETPGGCWAHFSVLDMDGHRSLEPGSDVVLLWERAAQDGYAYRAVMVRSAVDGH